jgi:cob(I)alamin adenosyltransferase
MKIYTKTGDNGTTFNGKDRVSKYDCAIDGQGEIEELNAWIGMIDKSIGHFETCCDLFQIQKALFNIGAQLATRKVLLKEEDIDFLEEIIDSLNEKLPELNNFIYPKGQVHVARAVCRRVERVVVAWRDSYKDCPECGGHGCMECVKKFDLPIKYLNRLSDYLFVLARYWSEDIIWKTDRND